MKFRYINKWLPFTSLLFCAQVLAVDIYALDIEGLHQKDKKGAYDQILMAVLTDSPESFTIHVETPEGADAKFATCTDCCMTPANSNKKFYQWGPEVKQTASMNWAKVYAFSASGTAAINEVAKLKGKRVGVRTGMPYGSDVDSAGLNMIAVDTIAENINKLKSGDIDVFLAYVPDAYSAFKELNMAPLAHAKKKPIAIHADALVCKGVSDNFMDYFDKKLKSLRKMGMVRRLLKDQYVKPI